MDQYEQYLDDVRYEIARVIELRRNRPLATARQSFWGPPVPSTSSAVAAATRAPPPITNTPSIDDDNDFKAVDVKAEVRRINSQIEAFSSKNTPPYEFVAIDISGATARSSQGNKVPLDKFSIGGDSDPEEVDVIKKYSGTAPEEFHEMQKQIEEAVQVNDQANCMKDVLKGSLVIIALLTVAIMMGCIYKSVLA